MADFVAKREQFALPEWQDDDDEGEGYSE